MSETADVFNLLDRMLPHGSEIAIATPNKLQRLYAGIGMPSLRVVELAKGKGFTTLYDCLADNPLYKMVGPSDIRRRYLELRAEVVEGNNEAMNDLGWLWLNGSRLVADPALAGQLLRLAADEGCGEALFNLAEMAWYGKGGRTDAVLAVDYYEQAFEAGVPGAARALGIAFESEELGGIEDLGKAASWYRQAVEEGDVSAGFYLGCLMLDEPLKEYDAAQGLYWLQWAAMQGEVLASERLTELYSSVFDSPPDPDGLLRRFWLERAINQGSLWAKRLSA